MNELNNNFYRRSGFVGLLVVLLIVIVIGLVLYFLRPEDSQKGYVETVVESKESAAEVVDLVNLTSIHRALQQYAIVNDGKFPESTDQLVREISLQRKLFERSANQPFLVYIPGQDESMPKSNVLIFQVNPSGISSVLLLGGSVEKLTAAQLDEILAEQFK